MNCFRILLYLFNIIFILIGIVLVSIGTWTAVSKIYVSYVIGDTLFSSASYLIIAVGIIIIIVCIVGIIALWKENRKWLIIYLCLLIFCFLILIIAAILAIVFKGEVEGVMVKNLRTSLINGYGKDRDITSAWDKLQTELHCCAISETLLTQLGNYNFEYVDGTTPQNAQERAKQDSWAVYKHTQFYGQQLKTDVNERKYVPESCCVYDSTLKDYKDKKHCQYFSSGPPFNYALDFKNDNLYYVGCYEKGKQLVLDQSDIIVALGFVFAFIMIAGMVLTFFVIRSTGSDDDDETKHRRQPNRVV